MTGPVRFTPQQMETQAELIEHGGWTVPERSRVAAMLRQAAAEGQKTKQLRERLLRLYAEGVSLYMDDENLISEARSDAFATAVNEMDALGLYDWEAK